ncbi:secretogranin-2b precursor [Danio rerio]|uniref:Secretogranin-2b n=1 Tax=Danio rerio TaxID=7955 RepID=SCG2B_DANRE|nr:secretogranin-2b precursor [Danio rerio]A0JMK6.1 RecName: Full=Secretogranin-2b; AltName: Full=Secretogranin II b; Contains: RecName: Full=Secretoneurin-b; Short=SNb; Flags: Precursor [Danio rerio]AAI25914.1 Zgc:153925 [Danio rerio]AAI64414.1 Zgc:153925 protein [Danio rerio]|eukprot:NP_001071216.1 secretogranin-2 precursor [Danio rerio]
MMLSLPKLSAGGVVVLLATLLHTLTVQGASVRHHRLRGGDQGGFLAPSSDMIKALEYIESLKQRADGPESPTGDYDEVDKFRFLVQLASLQDENTPTHEDATRWPDNKVPQWVRSLLRVLDQAGESPESQAAGNERRLHKTRRPVADGESPAGDYAGFVKPHKKYPLMFEDEENGRDNKRATEDLDEQYTPQSLANMRSIFEELGKLSAAQKRDDEEDGEDDDDLYRVRNAAYEDVTGGEEWVPLEEQLETEELVKGSHEEYKRALGDISEQGMENMERRGEEEDENPDDDTKLVDYYLLKVLEMTDQAQKRDLMEGRRRLLSRPSLIDPRAIKQLLSAISMKLQVPPEDLVGMLFMEETRKQQQRLPEPQLARNPSQPRYKSRVIKYYNGRQPEVTVSDIPHDVKTEDILKVLGLGNLANKNAKFSLLKQRPYKTAMTNYFNPNGRRGSLFLSELNKAPSKRKDDYDDDDAVDEDEESTFLAAKLLTEYPDTSSSNRKRAIDSAANGQLPYELYEEAMKDFFDQVDNGKSALAKRDTQGKEEPEGPQKPPAQDPAQETVDQTPPESGTEDGKEYHGKIVAGM